MTAAVVVTAVERRCVVMSEGLYIKSHIEHCNKECTHFKDSAHVHDTFCNCYAVQRVRIGEIRYK